VKRGTIACRGRQPEPCPVRVPSPLLVPSMQEVLSGTFFKRRGDLLESKHWSREAESFQRCRSLEARQGRTLDVVVKIPDPVFVRFFRGASVILGFFCLKTCLLPALPGEDRVIGGRESLLVANGGDPSINRLLVKKL
jgi:hypothetical protein